MSACRRRSHFPLLQPGAVGVLAAVSAVAALLTLVAITMRIGATVIRRPLLALALVACAACLSACLTGCATAAAAAGGIVTFEAALRAAGMTVDAYCGLTPEGRADLRERLNLPHLVRCAGDPAAAP